MKRTIVFAIAFIAVALAAGAAASVAAAPAAVEPCCAPAQFEGTSVQCVKLESAAAPAQTHKRGDGFCTAAVRSRRSFSF